MIAVDQIAARIRSEYAGHIPISEHDALKLNGVGRVSLSLLKDMGLVSRMGNLSTRTKSILHNNCLYTKQQTLDAIQSGALRVGTTRRYGNKTHTEVCDWLGQKVAVV